MQNLRPCPKHAESHLHFNKVPSHTYVHESLRPYCFRGCFRCNQHQKPHQGFFFNKFPYFWLHWVFVAVCRLSLVAAGWGYSSLQYAGFSLQWLLLLRSTGSRHVGLSSCGTRAQQLWSTGLVAPWHVGSSWTRD